MTLLIVDDDQDQCDSLADVLNDAGYDVDTASSGKEAVEMASRKPYLLAEWNWPTNTPGVYC